MRRGLQRINERPPRAITLKFAEFLRGDHNDFITPMHRHVLRAVAVHAAHELAEARLGILQHPVARRRGWALRGRLGLA